jgi:hypothetical protein
MAYHTKHGGRLVPDESMVLSVDPEKLMVRKAKGRAPLAKAIEWRVVVALVMFMLWKLKGDLSICEHQNKVITYPYDPFEWWAVQTQGAEKAAL